MVEGRGWWVWGVWTKDTSYKLFVSSKLQRAERLGIDSKQKGKRLATCYLKFTAMMLCEKVTLLFYFLLKSRLLEPGRNLHQRIFPLGYQLL